MAELLIYNKTHWMEAPSKDRPDLTGYENVQRKINENTQLTLAESTKAIASIERKYNSRYRGGDIVEVRPDNKPRGKLEEDAFLFIKVPSLSMDEAKQYMQAHMDGETMLHRRKYWIDITGLKMNDTLTIEQWQSRLREKK